MFCFPLSPVRPHRKIIFCYRGGIPVGENAALLYQTLVVSTSTELLTSLR